MAIDVPNIGSRVRVTTAHRNHVQPYAHLEDEHGMIRSCFEGTVVQSIFKNPTCFAVRTGRQYHPVSEFNIAAGGIVQIEYLSGSGQKLDTSEKGWRVKSKGNIYFVLRSGSGKYTCTCKGFEFRRNCRHISAVGRK